MKFMILVKASPASEAGVMPSTELLTAMGKFNEELVAAGVMLAGEGLHPSSRGVRVRFSGDRRTVIDGPFAETKELLAGYWLWQVKSLEEAIGWLKRCPNPHEEETEVEIRQVFEMSDFGAEMTPELREQEERMLADMATRRQEGGEAAGVRALLDAQAAALRAKDAAGVLACYAPDVVSFDLAPPLARTGADARDRGGLEAWFATWAGPIGWELRDLAITIAGDTAFAHGFVRISGTKVEGGATAVWARLTVCLGRRDGRWKIVHEHRSVPFYMDGSVKAAVDLAP